MSPPRAMERSARALGAAGGDDPARRRLSGLSVGQCRWVRSVHGATRTMGRWCCPTLNFVTVGAAGVQLLCIAASGGTTRRRACSIKKMTRRAGRDTPVSGFKRPAGHPGSIIPPPVPSGCWGGRPIGGGRGYGFSGPQVQLPRRDTLHGDAILNRADVDAQVARQHIHRP